MNSPKSALLSVLVADEPAAHERLANVLRRRAPGVVSTSVATGEEPGMARVTVTLFAPSEEIEMLRRQLEKMIDVVEAKRVEDFVGVQLALFRVQAAGVDQGRALDVLARVGARLMRKGPKEIVAQVADDPERIEAALAELSAIGQTTAMRTGLMAMAV